MEEKEYEKMEDYDYEKDTGEYKDGAEKDDAEDDIVVCSGCLVNGTCFSFENRRAGKYCSYDGVFVNQSGDGALCDNNFECESNVCVSGECIDQGLINKVLSWFRKVFG